MAATILIVDDNPGVRGLLQVALDQTQYKAVFAGDGQEAIRSFFQYRPDLVILDVMLPGMSGWEILERIREMTNTPVIMLTALGQVQERVRGLREGADDYLTKPFSPEELLARCDALLRRGGLQAKTVQSSYNDAALRIDFEQHTVYLEGGAVVLSPVEFKLLGALVLNAGKILECDRLIEIVWGEDSSNRGGLRLYIAYLRKKLHDDASKPRLIETVRGVGYRYKLPRAVSTDVISC